MYREFLPHPDLRLYIDAYWVYKSQDNRVVTHRIFPDGCIDIIVNIGDDFITDNGRFIMKSERAYLVGTMTKYKDTIQQPGSHLLGIRFKPLGFSAFYQYASLHEVTENTVEFEQNFLPEVRSGDHNIFGKLDAHFYSRLCVRTQRLSHAVNDIEHLKGLISVENLAQRHSVTSRQLERQFKQHLGISPKEYANFVRYQHAAQLIKSGSHQNLLDIALEAGYYDHAHMTNEIKKYSGLPPSVL